MRYRLMASYQGATYQAGVGPSSREVTLFAVIPPPEEHDFISDSGHWRKEVRISEIDALWESRPVGSYHGEPCLVLDDLGDRLHITYLGMDEMRAIQLGYWQVDRGVFEVVVPREEIADLAEELHEFPMSTLIAALPPAQAPDGPAEAGERAPYQAPYEAPAAPSAPPVPAGAAAWHGSPEPDGDGTWYPHPAGNGSHPGWADSANGAPAVRPDGGMNQAGAAPAGAGMARNGARDTGDLLMAPVTGSTAASAGQGVVRGRRAARKPRVATQSLFAELLDLANIPRSSYAVDEEVSGAMCLIKTGGGFEVFSCADEARHEVRFFEDEEGAYFYLFGVLAAEALRNGRLAPQESSQSATFRNTYES